MKYIALLLLLANVAYFVEGRYFREQSATRTAAIEPLPDVPALVLLGEQQPDTVNTSLQQAIDNPVDAARVANCSGIGPFRSVSASQAFQERLASVGVETRLSIVDKETGEFDYRVIIPPHASAEAAFRRLRELQARDIDSYVITQGRDALAISMGVFSSIGAANRVRNRLASSGYKTTISDIPQIEREYWLLPGNPAAVARADVKDLLLAEYPGLGGTMSQCFATAPDAGADG